MKIDLALTPFICVTGTWDCPSLGIFEDLRILKYSQLTVNEAIQLGFLESKDDLYERGLPKYWLVYTGKLPSLKKIKTIKIVVQPD